MSQLQTSIVVAGLPLNAIQFQVGYSFLLNITCMDPNNPLTSLDLTGSTIELAFSVINPRAYPRNRCYRWPFGGWPYSCWGPDNYGQPWNWVPRGPVQLFTKPGTLTVPANGTASIEFLPTDTSSLQGPLAPGANYQIEIAITDSSNNRLQILPPTLVILGPSLLVP